MKQSINQIQLNELYAKAHSNVVSFSFYA